MSDVSIESLTIENFGPYYGAHTLSFGNLEGKCGILVGGKNGAGKTHLLRALYLAVVGESGVGDLKKVEPGSDATRFIFERSLNRKAQAEGEDTTRFSITISQRDATGGGARKITLVREIRHRPSSPPVWSSYAQKSDLVGQISDEQVIQKLRDAFLPRHLARFFFFDAERSQSVHLGQQDIVEGISRILGLWTYGELETDLRQLVQSKIPKVFNSSGAADAAARLADASGRIVTAEGTLKARKKELTRLEDEERVVEAELAEIVDELKTIGAVDPEELERSQLRRGEIAHSKVELETHLQTSWELAMPVALMGGYRRELYDYLEREEKRRDWENSKAAVEPKIPQVKGDVFEGAPREFALTADYHAFYSSRLEKALLRLFNPPPEGMSDSVFATDRNDTSAQVRARLGTGVSGLKGLADACINLERLESEGRELEQKFKLLTQNTGALVRGNELHGRRGEKHGDLKRLAQRKTDLEAEIIQLEAQLAELRREEKNFEEVANKAEKGQTLITLATHYREAAAEIRAKAAVQMRKRISEHVGELWVEITERDREFAGMDFDNHWNCFLVRRDGKKVSWEEVNTSAGQRQVRLLAFYEALRRLARLVPPLVVDTPLGRLDKEVKDAVLNRLYLQGHQSIILSTNSEIDPDSELFSSITDRLARVYTLHPHGKPGSTDYEVRIEANYFGRTP
jgi:DNA sulfur modification protein DndD